MTGLTRFDEVIVTCRGEPDPCTGYLVDIKSVDRAVRATLAPAISLAAREPEAASPCRILRDTLTALDAGLGGILESVRWQITPYYSMDMSTQHPSRARLRQRFDFAAAHRLHNPQFSAEENRRLFGKCNNANGHGHNYQFEPCVEVELDAAGAESLSLCELESLAESVLIDRFDHKHLNEDTDEFRTLNPTVENIARVIFQLLADQLGPVRLHGVRVYETPKTWADYPG